jgi:hypothetical protein
MPIESSANRDHVRRLAVPLAITATIVVAVIAALALSSPKYRTDGPWTSPDRVNVDFPIAANQSATWGMPLPKNPTLSAITIESIEPLDVRGIDVLGVRLGKIDATNGSGSIVNAPQWPPEGIDTLAVDGVVLPPVGAGSFDLQVLVGVRHEASEASGSIGGIRIRYELAGAHYEVLFPWSLGLSQPTGS